MTMSMSARAAFEELKALGAPVRDWSVAEGYGEHVAFVLIWANGDTSQVYADKSGRYIREIVVGDRYINPLGYRQDVHEILAKHELVSDHAGGGHIVIYNDPDAAGCKHSEVGYVKRHIRPDEK